MHLKLAIMAPAIAQIAIHQKTLYQKGDVHAVHGLVNIRECVQAIDIASYVIIGLVHVRIRKHYS
jgi:hypothetical protein